MESCLVGALAAKRVHVHVLLVCDIIILLYKKKYLIIDNYIKCKSL